MLGFGRGWGEREVVDAPLKEECDVKVNYTIK